MLELYGSVENASMLAIVMAMIAVVDLDVVEADAAWAQVYAVASVEVVASAKDVNGHRHRVEHKVALKVQLFEGTIEVGMTRGLPLQVGEERIGELVDEIGVEVARLHVELHAASRFMTRLDEGCDVTDLSLKRLVYERIEVDGTLILTPETTCDVELSEQTIVERELVDAQVGIDCYVVEEPVSFHFACS